MSHVHPTSEKPVNDFIPGIKDHPPKWYGGGYIWNKQWGSGAKHSGPSGKRAGRYYPPVAITKKVSG